MSALTGPRTDQAPWRVLFLVTEAFGGRGGVAAVTRDMAEAFHAYPAVRETRILPLSVDDADAATTSHEGIRQGPPAGRARFVYRALETARRMRPTHVYVNHVHLAPVALAAARIAGAPLVHHAHGIEIYMNLSPRRRAALEASDLVLAVSRDTRARVLAEAALAPEKVATLNNSFGAEFRPQDRARARARFGFGDAPTLITVGRLNAAERYKGHDRVIDALPHLAVRWPDIRYVIVGDGDDRGRLEARALSAGVIDRVRFLGYASNRDLPALYSAADLYVMPSTGEGFGIAFVEAMACGAPSLGLDIAGARDALTGDGAYASSGVAFEADLEAALDDALAMTEAARASLAEATLARWGRGAFRAHLHRLLDARFTAPERDRPMAA